MILGVTGTLAAGKDTISGYLEKKGFKHFSLSDAIRMECDSRGLPKDRDTLVRIGNELRETYGADILAQKALNIVKRNPQADYVFTSIRNPAEAMYLKKQPAFFLMSVDAPIETRYQRIVARKNEMDSVDFQTFKKQEETEMSGSNFQQNLTAVKNLSDFAIMNDGTVEELYQKIEDILVKIHGN